MIVFFSAAVKISETTFTSSKSLENGRQRISSREVFRQELLEIFDGDLGDFKGETGYVGLNTLAMGDLCACEFAQAAHVNLLLPVFSSLTGWFNTDVPILVGLELGLWSMTWRAWNKS